MGKFLSSRDDYDRDLSYTPSISRGRRHDNNNNLRLSDIRLKKLSVPLGEGTKERKNSTRLERVEAERPKLDDKTHRAKVDQAILDDFVETYTKIKADGEAVKTLLSSQLIDNICEIMQRYYDPVYSNNIIESMNNIIRIMTTRTFAVNLMTLIKEGEAAFEYWEEDRKLIGELISIVFDTQYRTIAEETKSIYMELLVDYIWQFEIKEIQNKFFLSQDAALDLVLGVPKFGNAMTDGEIRRTHTAFVDLLINHGGSAIDYLTAGNQKKLFYYLYPDTNKTAIKAAAYCLSAELLEFEEELGAALYNEYISMLYTLVDEHDIEDIRIVLRTVRKAKAKLITDEAATTTVFDTKTAVEYANIRTTLLDYIEHNKDAKSIFSE